MSMTYKSLQSNFTAGELDPLFDASIDNGLKILLYQHYEHS